MGVQAMKHAALLQAWSGRTKPTLKILVHHGKLRDHRKIIFMSRHGFAVKRPGNERNMLARYSWYLLSITSHTSTFREEPKY